MAKTNQQIQEDLHTLQMIKDVLEVDGHTAVEFYKVFKQSESDNIKSELELQLLDLKTEFEDKLNKLILK